MKSSHAKKISGSVVSVTKTLKLPFLFLNGVKADEFSRMTNYRNGLDFVTDVPPFPWEPLVPFTEISGGHDSFPSLFMYHHIDYYCSGISLVLRGA